MHPFTNDQAVFQVWIELWSQKHTTFGKSLAGMLHQDRILSQLGGRITRICLRVRVENDTEVVISKMVAPRFIDKNTAAKFIRKHIIHKPKILWQIKKCLEQKWSSHRLRSPEVPPRHFPETTAPLQTWGGAFC